MAMASAFPDSRVEEYSVSNAVVWSIRKTNDSNANPDDRLINKSISFWSELLPILQPRLVVCSGAIARQVIEGAWNGDVLPLRLPSPLAMARLVGLFDSDDLLSRFPEVTAALQRLATVRNSNNLRNKVLFACHAVSVASRIVRE